MMPSEIVDWAKDEIVYFKDEALYLKKDIVELHTSERWHKDGRQVLEDATPVRRIKGVYNDPERVANLYGIWQTKAWCYKLTPDGHIPKNDYGNIELFNGPLPETTCWINVPKVMLIAKKLGVEAVPSVVGFEKLGGGRSMPTILGAVCFKKDKESIIRESQLMAAKSEEKLRKKVEKAAKDAWQQLIRAILIKKYVNEKYDA